MSKSMKRSRPKETEESPKKSKSSNHGQEQIDVVSIGQGFNEI